MPFARTVWTYHVRKSLKFANCNKYSCSRGFCDFFYMKFKFFTITRKLTKKMKNREKFSFKKNYVKSKEKYSYVYYFDAGRLKIKLKK